MERKTHAWRNEEREYERHVARRGRRHAFTTLVPARTALIVIDMVPFHNATLHTIYRTFGDVRATDEVISLGSLQL
ncbi:hypothetical protein [Allorhizocola rhizosphaerae]|uniref:hypothetical protein n=1 Tax=Allorhizocola rhizosphaerae TaxID=1872709 RepID=UPI001B8CFD71|nr:hypothetical protein [Allorhizocola rhizosphaerae]